MFGTLGIGLTNLSLPQQYKYQEVDGQEFPEEEVSTPEDGSIVTENTAAPGVEVVLEICGDY